MLSESNACDIFTILLIISDEGHGMSTIGTLFRLFVMVSPSVHAIRSFLIETR